ncbi:MAG: tetratricopeptide repeat protein [Bacteroidales bacterium]|nr:tetratricopeptide repeat protein [Candidatus Cryptobacteroides choladohippi]
MRRLIAILTFAALCLPVMAQVDRHEVRAGNRKFNRKDYAAAEIDYRKAVLKDTSSVAGQYNLASSLYRQEDYQGAQKALDAVKENASVHKNASDYHFNAGDVALQNKDYAAAVEAFRESLLRNPGDLDAKENYIYAKKMLENQQNGGGGQNDQNDQSDQNQQDDQNQNNQDNQQNQDSQDQQNDQDQNQNDQNQNGQDQNNQDQDSQQGRQPQISEQQAQQMLQAIQAQEKKTQDKVNKEKAALLQSKQKEKNW